MESRSFTQSPWFTIWVNPRQTLRRILEGQKFARLWLIVMLGGVYTAFDRLSSRGFGDNYPLVTILAGVFILGPLLGLFGWLTFSTGIKFSGLILRGKASFKETLLAIGLVDILLVWGLILWAIRIILFGIENFSTYQPYISSSPILGPLYFSFQIIAVLFLVWYLIVLIKLLSEAQQFSVWKALLNILLAFVVLVLGMIVLLKVLGFLLGILFFPGIPK